MYPKGHRLKAYTLIEVMVVVATIGILASIAMPAYFSTVRQTRRVDAEQALQLFRQAMERHYSKTYSYTGAAEGGGNTGSPAMFSHGTPLDGGVGEGYYELAIEFANASCFEISATPTAKGQQAGDRCGPLVLNHAGQRGSALTDGTCWNGTDSYDSLDEDACG